MSNVSGRVLDYGCGYGDIAFAVSQSNPVVGCDIDADRVAFAATEYAPIPFSQCTASSTPFADQSFDAVLSVVVIHFVPEPIRYLAEVKRLLKPGGAFVIVCQNEPVVRNVFRRALCKDKVTTNLWVPSKADMTKAIAGAGFEIIDSTYFYDPPVHGWKNPGDWLFGTVEQFFSILHLSAVAGYYGYVTRKAAAEQGAFGR